MAKSAPAPAPARAPAPTPEKEESDLTKSGALWLKTAKGGSKYMSGQIEVNGETISLTVFRNGFKKLDKHPDYVIYIRSETSVSTPPDDTDIPF